MGWRAMFEKFISIVRYQRYKTHCRQLSHVQLSSRLVLMAEERRVRLLRLCRHSGATYQTAIWTIPQNGR
jgi:hypothetical protein